MLPLATKFPPPLMSRYRKVLCKIWSDDKFPALSLEAKLLFLYHLTSARATPFLLYAEGTGSMGDALGMTTECLTEAMGQLVKMGMVWYADDASRLLFVPKALLYRENAPESPNAVKMWVSLFEELPRTSFLSKCIAEWVRLGEGIGHDFIKAFVRSASRLGNGLAIQEQEQEQEQEKKHKPQHKATKARKPMGDEEFIESLRKNPAYGHLSVDTELGRMDAWLSAHPGRLKTRRFIVGWLNRQERPVTAQATGRQVNDPWKGKTEAREVKL